MKSIKGGVTKALGFKANGLHCGIKRTKDSDLSLIVSDVLCNAACVFTKNSVKAAPVIVTQEHIHNLKAQAIIANSGNANCFTGHFGLAYAKRTTKLIAKLLGIKDNNVLVASTGIIGKPLPYKNIEKLSPKLVKGLSKQNGTKAAKAILTTDTVKKESCVTVKINGKNITIGGCAKGAGMIEPNMATMLAFITSDAAITGAMIKAALKDSVDESFNCITIDGCMSTNDLVVVLANGEAKNKLINKKGKDYKTFAEALGHVCLDLAKQIVKDGEGSTKFIEVTTTGALNKAQAKKVSYRVANSNLVKTAAFGENPNWGRVAAAVGGLGLPLTEQNFKINFSSFKKKNIKIQIALNLGKASATVYTTDLSYAYVKINAEYN